MMLVVNGDDGSHAEFEELGNGNLRVLYRDGITHKEVSTIADIREYPNVCTYVVQSRIMLQDLKLGASVQK